MKQRMKQLFMRTLVAIFLCCVILTDVGCGDNIVGPPGVSIYLCEIGDTIEVDRGTLSLDEITVVKEITKEQKTYESRKHGFLIFRLRFNFKKYSLRTCGVWIKGPPPDYDTIFINYRHIAGHQGLDCPVKKDGDFNIEVSTILSAELHIGEEEGETKGTVYLCFDLTSDIYDYLYDRRYLKVSNDSENNWSNILLYLNDVGKTGITRVEIGGSFCQLSFVAHYVIAE